jgi:hypothetical protein
MGLRVSLVTAVHRRELDWITNEEDRLNQQILDIKEQNYLKENFKSCTAYRVVENEILVSLVGVELHGPSVHIARSIGRSGLGPNR